MRYDFYIKIYTKKHYQNRGLCPVCKNPVELLKSQLAHRIADTKTNRLIIKKWLIRNNMNHSVDDILSHQFNLVLVCSLECNSNKNIGNQPSLVDKFLSFIWNNWNKNYTDKEIDSILEYMN